MKTIRRIAKTELRTLFYSPIAWFLIIVFFIQCGIMYISEIKNIALTQELGGIGATFLTKLTSRVFLGPSGLFSHVMQNLYLYIPLLTMSLISRETGSGTIKLLYSSPIKVRQIVFGKYLAMMIYSLLLVAIVSVFILSGICHIQHAETGMLLVSILGFYLLLCAYAAIGLFMSTLTTYQVIAAICTFIMIGILSYIGGIWQRIAFVRELTYFLSINGRTQKMLMGLVTTNDIIYFLVIVYLFLGFSIYKLKDGMQSKPWSVKAMRYVTVTAIGLLVGYLSSIPGFIGYYDATYYKTNTLTPPVQAIMKDLGNDPLEITAYANLVDQYYFLGDPDSYNQNLSRWDPYMRFKANIRVNTVSYYDSALMNPYLFRTYPGKNLKEIADQNAKKYDMDLSSYLTPAEIRKEIDLRPESNRYVMQMRWKGRKAWLRVFDDVQIWPSETEIATAFKRLQGAKLPKVAFVTGDLERDIDNNSERDYKLLTNAPTFRYSLINQGFDVESVVLDTQDIPADISVLVLADPKVELSDIAKAKLKQYIQNGGNLLLAGEPGRQAITAPILKEIGVKLSDGLLIQESRSEPNVIKNEITPFAGTFYKALEKAQHDSMRVYTPNAAEVTWSDSSGFSIQPLLKTLPKISWKRMKPFDPEMMMIARVDSTHHSKEDEEDRAMPGRPIVATRPDSAGHHRGFGHHDSAGRQKVIVHFNGGVQPDSITRHRIDSLIRLKMDSIMHSAAAGRPGMQPDAVNRHAGMPVVSNDAVMPSHTGAPHGLRTKLGMISFSPADGDVKGPITSAISLVRKINNKEQRIIVTGDADLINNTELKRYGAANFQFSTAIFRWLGGGEYPLETTRPDARDKKLNVTLKQINALRIIYVWVVPAILALFATILLVRRKRK